ncbi:MAG: hypothetical protein ABSE64_09840 [Vulcanimicrobiaceae bacterium]|jgi:hypothetical protein
MIVRLVAISAIIFAVLLVTRPHVQRYYALVDCSRTEKCWTEIKWAFRASPLDEFPDYHSCAQELIRFMGDHPSKDDAILCVERYKLEWGYRD